MENNSLTGSNSNAKEPELPIGFGMRLAQEPEAMQAYSSLSNTQKREVIHYMQAAATGKDSEYRVMSSVEKLKNKQITDLCTDSHQDNYF